MDEARRSPIADSVNIPLTDLGDRTSELQDRGKVVRVVGPDALAGETVAWLRAHGRKAVQITNYQEGEYGIRGRLWSPNEWLWFFLTTCRVHGVKPGAALDLGCGAGRDAVYLAAHGWQVTAVDRLPDCIERGRDLASHCLSQKNQDLINWQVHDVLSSHFDPGRHFELITSFYFFDRQLIEKAKSWLSQTGVLLIEAFTTIRQEQERKPSSADRVVKPGEMLELLSDMKIERLYEGEHTSGHTARVWAKKNG